MARPLRIEYPGAFYHVTWRGNERKEIFRSRRDREKFLEYLESATVRCGFAVHAYCLMTNHHHLLVETPEGNLARGMWHINGAYTTYFNAKRRRSGHLLQGRYKAILVEKDEYAEDLVRYVGLNPLRARLVSTLEELDRYPWSGHAGRTLTRGHPWFLCFIGSLGLTSCCARGMDCPHAKTTAPGHPGPSSPCDRSGHRGPGDLRRRSRSADLRGSAGRARHGVGREALRPVPALQPFSSRAQDGRAPAGVDHAAADDGPCRLLQPSPRKSRAPVREPLQEHRRRGRAPFLELVRYVALNPMRAGLLHSPQEFDRYPWSSHAVLVGARPEAWQDVDGVLARFVRRKKEALTRYRGFVSAGCNQGVREDLTGGGLLRSAGGAENVMRRRPKERESADERILLSLEEGGMSIAQLARRCAMNPASVSRAAEPARAEAQAAVEGESRKKT